ncbi:MAG: hypothetical protein Fur006_50920 [Coleofasciculaceae cyanobacterium]
MKTQYKTPKNSVGIESCQGRLRLRLPRRVYGGTQKYLTLGLTDTSENRKLAELKARQIEQDIISDNFDSTLAKYRPQTHLTVVETIKLNSPMTLLELWNKYTEYRKPQISETTLKLNYQTIGNHLKKLPFKDVSEALAIREYLLQHNSAYTTKRIITQLNACCDWAFKALLIDTNPFKGIAESIKVLEEKSHIDPFSIAERDAIIQAFEQHSTYCYYAPFVSFLFATGCRTSEAVGLRWKHINDDCSKITFSEAVVCVSSQKIRKDTKTHKSRKFPCNASLQKLLRSIQPENPDSDALVFPSLTGKEINAHTFNALCWKGTKVHGKYHDGIVTRLVKEGKVERYRPQFNTRHTFITLCLRIGISIVEASEWVGSSPDVITKHYAGVFRQFQVPEF